MPTRTLTRILCTPTPSSKGGFGFFRYARELAGPRPPQPLRQIFSLMRSLGCSFVVEESQTKLTHESLKELQVLRKERSAPQMKRETICLSFFRAAESEVESAKRFLATLDKNSEPDADREAFLELAEITANPNSGRRLELLGLLTLHVDRDTSRIHGAYVHDAFILNRRGESPYEFIHSQAKSSKEVLGKSFPITGSHFAQQQGTLTSCAHAALMVTARNIYEALEEECPLTYARINQIVKIDRTGPAPRRGLTLHEMAQALREGAGIPSDIFHSFPGESGHVEPEEIINAAYYCVETGLPAIITFASDRVGQSHAMAVVGHTFTPGLWQGCVTDAYFNARAQQYLPSHGWVESLLVQDDNFGPYCRLPKHILRERNPAVLLPRFPNCPSCRPEWVEIQVANFLKLPVFDYKSRTLIQDILAANLFPLESHDAFWFRVMLDHLNDDRLILRTIACTKKQYLKWLLKNEIVLPDSMEYIRLRDHLWGEEGKEPPFWLVEVSVPELYTYNERKLGEVVFYTGLPPGIERFSCVRLPGMLTLVDRINGKPEHVRLEGSDYHYPLIERSDKAFRKIFRYSQEEQV